MNRPPQRRPDAGRRTSSPAPGGLLRDRRVQMAGGGVLVLALLAFLFLGPCSILNPSDDDDAELYNCPTIAKPPELPDGFERVSDMKDFSEGRCDRTVPTGIAKITMQLEGGRPSRGLAFFTHTGDRWQRLGTAELSEDGRKAVIVVNEVPANGVILRRSADSFQTMAALPAGGSLNPEAERLATIVGAYDFVPAADGALSGAVTNVKRGETALLVPIVRAADGDEAQAVNAFIGQGERRSAHATALGGLVQSNRLDGIEIQYTAVDAGRRNDFTDLVRQVGEAVHRSGGVLTVSLPLPTKDGNNWNTGAYDWAQIGKLADYIKIAPEADQSIYRRVVPEALTWLSGQVEPRKLSLTLSAYAVEKSDQGLRPMTSLEALTAASQFTIRDRGTAATNTDVVVTADNIQTAQGGGGGITWDAIAAAVSFTYQREAQTRTIWIENQFSAAFKAEFVRLWRLGGVAVDDASANDQFSSIWPGLLPLIEGRDLLLLQPNSSLLKPEWLVDNKPYQAGQAAITWRTPADPGNHTVTLIVSDGEIRVQNNQRIALRQGPPVSASPTPTPPPAGSPRPGATAAPSPSPTPRR